MLNSKTVGAALVAALAFGASATAAPVAEFQMQYEDERAYVPVAYADNPLAWFILDTGSTRTAIDSGLAAQWGLKPEDAGTVSGAGAGSTKVGKVDNVTLVVAGIPFAFGSVSTAPLASMLPKFTGRPAPGIFGSRLFSDYVVEMDFPHNTIRLHDRASFAYAGPGQIVPIALDDGAPFLNASIGLPGGETIAGRFLIDTGAKATLLVTESFIAKHHLLDRFSAHVDSPLGSGIGGPTTYRFVRADSLSLEGGPAATLDGPIIGMSLNGSLKTPDLDGLLGAAYLRRFRVFFDYGGKQMILEPAFADNGPSEFDMSGLFFSASGEDLRIYTVLTVQPNSPAAELGVQVGDVLKGIELPDPPPVSLDGLRHLLIGEPGKTVHLDFERNGEPVSVVLTLRRLI